MALAPMLFVGLGGSGGKALRVVRQVLDEQLRAAGWEGDWPQGWQILHIDVAAVPDGVTKDLPNTLPATSYHPLTQSWTTYPTTAQSVSKGLPGGPEHYLALDCWEPANREEVDVHLHKGAGQFRAVGRMALLGGLAGLSARIGSAVQATRSSSMATVERALTGHSSDGNRDPEVWVVSSLAGGSGSGLLLDVCDVLRAHGARDVNVIALTPEVFEDEHGTLDPGVAPNTFLALSELSRARLADGRQGASPGRDALYRRAEVIASKSATGPARVYLVGRRNGEITLDNGVEIYKLIGESLAAYASSAELQDEQTAYAVGNQLQMADTIAHDTPLRAVGAGHPPNFYGRGFARLSLGRRVFRTYARERLARRAVDRLLHHHLTTRGTGEILTDDELIQRLAERSWPRFLERTGLSEHGFDGRGRSNDDVLDSLLDKGAFTATIGRWKSQAERQVGELENRVRLAEVRAKVQGAVESAIKLRTDSTGAVAAYLEAEQSVDERSRRWVKAIVDSFSDTVAQYAATLGLDTTITLLGRYLLPEMAKGSDELRAQARALRDDAAMKLANFTLLEPGEPERVRLDHDGQLVKEIVDRGADIVYRRMAAYAYEVAAQLLAEARDGLVVPWHVALSNARDALRAEVPVDPNRPSRYDYWPGDSGVPAHLVPSSAEFLLDRIDAFPEEFIRQVVFSVPEDRHPDDRGVAPVRLGSDAAAEVARRSQEALATAVTEVVAGQRLAPRKYPSFSTRTTWIPELETARPGSGQPVALDVALSTSLDDLLDRAEAWLLDGQKVVGRYLAQSLGEHLTDPAVAEGERIDRANRLVDQFARALEAAKPLVSFDTTLMQDLHGIGQPPVGLVMSPLAVPDDPALRQRLVQVAARALGPAVQIPMRIGPGQEFYAFTQTKAGVEPLAVSSVMAPITGQWLRASASDRDNERLWRWRRTRSLTEWVPLAPDAQLALATGWFVGQLLGHIRVEESAGGTWQIDVLDPDTGWTRLLPRAVRPITAPLAALLELVAVTQLEAFQEKSLEPLRPFARVMALGIGSHNGGLVGEWLTSGTGVGDPAEALILDQREPTTGEEREEALAAELELFRASYSGGGHTAPGGARPRLRDLQADASWEVAGLALEALEAIARVKPKRTGRQRF